MAIAVKIVNMPPLTSQLQEEARKELEKTSEVINDSLWYVNPKDIDPLITHAVQRTVEEMKKGIKNLQDKVHEEDSEKFGYDLLEEIGRCCPGDDAANVYEKALDDVLNTFTHTKKTK